MNYLDIIKQHHKFIDGEGEEFKADLRDANLKGADLSRPDLRDANLSRADLRGANLNRANLFKADLRGANLRGANLRGANLSRANLREADLSRADLSWANLSGARGVISISFDPRGWTAALWKKGDNFWINAGCRSFSLEDAFAHWGGANYPNKERGNRYVESIKFLIQLQENNYE
jgi:hypothetical protein